MATTEQLDPNYGKLDAALRAIGYSLESAVADIVDNSIDAQAKNILVRIVIREDCRLDLAIRDDGKGMDERTLREAMRFGSDVSTEIGRLGKFGLGLKLASLSQGRELKVITARHGQLAGRAWLDQGISQGFMSTIFSGKECSEVLAKYFPDKPRPEKFTAVIWSPLYRTRTTPESVDEVAQKLGRGLETYLSIAFHRFLQGRPRKIGISVDIFDSRENGAGIPVALSALDPFAYPQSGDREFPASFRIEGEYGNRVQVKAHIWPPNSDLPAYRLPGGANGRQGFYFFRNNRLIQGGGWNGVREIDPHLSLARLEIDLSPEIDIEMSLDVKKVEIHIPPALSAGILSASTANGVDFKKYLGVADKTYRKRKLANNELPLIPTTGIPKRLSRFMQRELRLETTDKFRGLRIAWKRLEAAEFFQIDRENERLYVNRRFRRRLLHGTSSSSADAPVLKCLLFLALRDALSSEREGTRIRERIEQANKILVRAVRCEREPK
jgi:hypothetical protein